MSDSKHPMQADGSGTSRNAGDSVDQPEANGRKTSGESGGGFYPNPHRGKKPGRSPSDFLGHGGQTVMAYHGTGQLGDKKIEGQENPNSPSKEE
ncbi:hypothetical protein CLG96_02595 [Sphingomonas oleivorans]|uniref:Uncharacterized protein n=1 Tax=Sphingomonas oleivorans TaxID=1735121 RepID=A0A2T5G1L1_9SPHN|nr:hypothetical protein [Sphingomonas oleivorans]PTQ13047.1 hypothetical protein CLG96_02595 [Sphingomonas oleivorans]